MASHVKCALAAKPSPVWIAVALAVVTLAVYCPVTGFRFVGFDDPDYVLANPHVRGGLSGEDFKWAWGSEVAGNWHPITMFSHMLDCQLFGVKPWWPHLVNMVLHAANSVLLFGLFKRMTGAVWRSAVVAALFALHPLHVESVAWVSERKDVLSTLFWFLTTWAYVRYADKWRVESGEWRVFYGLSLVFFALGLMSKPMLVTLPFTLLLLDFWPLKRRAVVEKIPYFAMSAAMCVVTFEVQNQSGTMLLLQNVPPAERVGNALVSYARYIGMMFWPRHLAGFYPMRLGSWPWWAEALAALLLVAVSALVLAQWRRRPYLAAGWFWYVGTLVPVIGLVQVGGQAMADRYTYVPLIGLFVMVAWGGWELAQARGLGRLAAAATAAALAGCAAMTVHQEFFWKDTETLNQRMIEATSNNYLGHNNLGVLYYNANRRNEAISHFMAAVKENPYYADAHYNLGAALAKKGQIDEAMQHFQEAMRLKPNDAKSRYDVGTVLGMNGRTNEAISEYREAIRLRPDYADAHKSLGVALDGQGQIDEAIGQFREAIRLEPDDAEACYNLGTALGAKGQFDEAISQLRQAIRLNPDYPEACNKLGMALGVKGQIDEAISQFREAIRLKPDDAEARNNLAHALKMKNAPTGR